MNNLETMCWFTLIGTYPVHVAYISSTQPSQFISSDWKDIFGIGKLITLQNLAMTSVILFYINFMTDRLFIW